MPRYPIFPLRARLDDRANLEAIRKRYGLRTLAEAFRIASRLTVMLKLSPEQVRELNEQYEERTEGVWPVAIHGGRKS